jgi:hypothetical protein
MRSARLFFVHQATLKLYRCKKKKPWVCTSCVALSHNAAVCGNLRDMSKLTALNLYISQQNVVRRASNCRSTTIPALQKLNSNVIKLFKTGATDSPWYNTTLIPWWCSTLGAVSLHQTSERSSPGLDSREPTCIVYTRLMGSWAFYYPCF